MDLPARVKQKLRDMPDQPGCYIMRDRGGRIIYVGKAASLRKRVQSYFREATARRGSPKLRGLVRSVCDIEVVVLRNEAEALLTEGRLIKDYRPRYNVSFRDDKRFPLLRIDPSEPFPKFGLCRLRREDGCRYFGPYVSSAATRATLDFVEKQYGLRKCGPRVPTGETYRHCINDIIRYCAAPCVGRVDTGQYRLRVEDACAFLAGRRPQVLRDVRDQMRKAAEAKDYERAAALRDTLLHIERVVRQNARVAVSPADRYRLTAAGLAELAQRLDLAAPPGLIEAFDVSTISGTYSVASMVAAVDGVPCPSRYRHFRIRTVRGANDPAMIAEAVRRRYSRLRAEGRDLPGLVLVDGGLAQLDAARAQLDALGSGRRIAVAALAKRQEQLYVRPGQPPLSLPRDSEALKVMQRLRDEAHRFALTYHRRLRGQRVRESVLDEIEGIGRKRKTALLARFGSVRRIAGASELEIAAVPGIGPRMALCIAEFLRRGRGAP